MENREGEKNPGKNVSSSTITSQRKNQLHIGEGESNGFAEGKGGVAYAGAQEVGKEDRIPSPVE